MHRTNLPVLGALCFGLLLAPVTGARAQEPAAPDEVASAFLDPGARELVRLARERRRTVDRSIERYETTATERVSLGLRAVWRERLLWAREVATRIEWERDGPVRLEVLGAREVVPIAETEPRVPEALGGWVPRLAFDPADPYLLTGWGAGDGDVPHPLAPGSEAHYRFRTGDTTVIALPDGRAVRLIELEVLPRRTAWNLVQGSFWLDADSHAVVRATIRPSEPTDLERDRGDDVPGIVGPVRFAVEYVTLDYGLWELEWWLPRLLAIRGSASIGRLADLPFTYERTYEGYEVTGEPGGAEPLALEASPFAPGSRVRCRTRAAVSIQIGGPGGGARDTALVGDTLPTPADSVVEAPVVTDTTMTEEERRECERYTIVLPVDSGALLAAPHLPASPFRYGEALLSEAELEDIRERLDELPPPPARRVRPRLSGPLGRPGLVRYNKVEGLSLGARLEADPGPVRVEATARLGLADLEPRGELAVLRDGPERRLRLAAFRRLDAMGSADRPHSLGGTLGALLFGSDDADYYGTLGVELRGEPPPSHRRDLAWRVYVQRESPATRETDFSLAHLLDDEHRFSEGDSAAPATQYGAAVRLRRAGGHDPLGLRASAEVEAEAAGGTFDYGRSAVTLRVGFPVPGPWVGAVEGAAGSSVGSPAVQHLWRLGGPRTLRGYAPGVAVGESFWRARAEVATELPAVRLALFSDAGWAGSFEDHGRTPWLLSAGIGASLLDGLVRLDLARALRSPTGWRLALYLDAWL